MAVSTDKSTVKGGEGGERRGRYTRHPAPIALLTPLKLKLLGFLVECRILSLPQLASLGQLSQKATRRQMRALFDAGLVEVVAVSRAALAPEDAPNNEKLLFGTAPNFYTPTAAAVKALVDSGTLVRHYLKRSAPFYGPKNGLFLRHELLVRDVRVWLEQLAFAGLGRTMRWEDGVDAALDLRPGVVASPKGRWAKL